MSEEGVFAVHRGVFKHPMFADEPYTEREAWLWLLGNAAWKPMRTRAGKALVDLERGQLAYAGRFLAQRWKWPEARVRRFLKRLKTDAMIVVQTTRQTTQITICNYNEYQFSRRTSDAQIDARSDAQVTHERRKEEEVNKGRKEEGKKDAGLRPHQIDLIPDAPRETTDEADLYRRGREVLGKDAGGLIARLLRSKKGSVPLARAAIEQASTKHDAREYIGRIITGPAVANERHGINDPLAGII